MYFYGFRFPPIAVRLQKQQSGHPPPTKAHLLTKYFRGRSSRARAMKASFSNNSLCATYFPKTVSKAFVQLTTFNSPAFSDNGANCILNRSVSATNRL